MTLNRDAGLEPPRVRTATPSRVVGMSREQLREIEDRCRGANIECRLSDKDHPGGATLYLPAGRSTREIRIWTTEHARHLLEIPFERIRGIEGYDAYCSYDDGFIEAALETSQEFERWMLFESPWGYALSEQNETNDERFAFVANDRASQVRLTVGPATAVVRCLEWLRADLPSSAEPDDFVSITLRVDGVSISRHDQAKDLLERIGNAALFQADLTFAIPMYLAAEGSPERRERNVDGRAGGSPSFPKYQYESTPMASYWYARTAVHMPLVQYLAYYQVIEFFFPIFAEKEALEIIQRRLKDPSFDPRNNTDVGRLLGALKPHLAKGGYGDERAMLLATIKGCVTGAELRAFLDQDPEMSRFLASKQAFASTRVSLEHEDAEIVAETAARIYEIRCKIVHAKATEQSCPTELLLPFSKEAQQLSFDVKLIRFIAQRVLIATGTPLVIQK